MGAVCQDLSNAKPGMWQVLLASEAVREWLQDEYPVLAWV